MTRRTGTFAALAAAAALGFTVFTPALAYASPPTMTSQQINISVPLPTSFTGCATPITVTEIGTLNTTTFYDQNGNPTEILQLTPNLAATYVSASGTVYASVSPASTRLDLATGTITFDGLQAHIIIPGTGLVGAATGHVMFNTTTGALLLADGQTTLLMPFSPTVCALLDQ